MDLKKQIKDFNKMPLGDKIILSFAYIAAIVLPITMIVSLFYITFLK